MAISLVFAVALVMVGLCFGSLVTLLSYRLPRKENVFFSRSRCPRCKTVLRVRDLVPVLSWCFFRGRCAHCRGRISPRYPMIEVVQAALFVICYFRVGLSWDLAFFCALAVLLLAMVVVDLEHYIIPDGLQLSLFLLGIGYALYGFDPLVNHFLSAGIGLMLGLLLHYGFRWVKKKEGLGFGDVKFLAVAGMWLPQLAAWPVYLFVAGVLGIITALIWRISGRGEEFPFGPALAAALFFTLLAPLDVLFTGQVIG